MSTEDKVVTSYPSIDKVWLIYDYFLENNKDYSSGVCEWKKPFFDGDIRKT